MSKRGRYRLVRKIADGGMAEIYLGTQHGVEGFERPVVLKRILGSLLAEPQFKNLMIDEAHVAMTLLHSNITQVLDLGQAKGRYYLVLEFVDGWDLNNILNRLKHVEFTLPPELALFIAAEVCRALAYAHGKKRDGKPMGIVHRDVSPHNVLVSSEGEVKLTDFGIAKALVKRENTVQGVIKGKLAFMSPEQASGAVIDLRSDLFSVGTLLYQMTTGKRPFDSPTDLESLLRVQKGEFPPPEVAKPDVAPALAALIAKTMSLRPSERFQTADEMVEAMESLQRSAFVPAGKTELKRWLTELERRDGLPSIGRIKAPSADPNETMELVDEDIEFEDSTVANVSALRGAPRPATPARGGTDTLDDPGFKPTDQALDTLAPTAAQSFAEKHALDPLPDDGAVARPMGPLPTAPTVIDMQGASNLLVKEARERGIDPLATDTPARSRRGWLLWLLLAGAGAGAYAWWRRQSAFDGIFVSATPPQPTPTTASGAGGGTAGGPIGGTVESTAATGGSAQDGSTTPTATAALEPDAAPAMMEADASAATGADAAEGEINPDEDEERLLRIAEPGITEKVIESPEEAPRPTVTATRAPDAKPTPTSAVAKPPAQAPIVSVHVSSTPAGAVVRLNKRVFGRAPIDLRFRSGITYELNFVKQGYLPVSKKFAVSRRQKQTLSVALRKRPVTKRKGFFQRLFGR